MFNQLDGDEESFLLDGMFLILFHIGFGTGYRKSSLFEIILLPYWGIGVCLMSGSIMNLSYFPNC